jgi:phage baseplate assembly protein W
MVNTPITNKRILYSDFGKDLDLHPVSNDIARKTNEQAIKESIRNLILTNRGERLFQPLVGCDITQALFENIDVNLVNRMKDSIRETLETFEPRCNLLGVDVFANPGSNEVRVVIVFSVINSTDEPTTLEVVLDRIR